MVVFKKIIIGIAVVFSVVIISGGVFLYRVNGETKKMEPTETMEFLPGVYAVKDSYVNMYLIKAGTGFIAIDSGANANNINCEMDYLQISPEKVVALFLTHTDTDHIGAITSFKNAKIYISREEEPMIDGTTDRTEFGTKNKKIAIYSTIEDGQEFEISGVRIKGILTPGHTIGSMTYIINGKYLFVGDTLRLKNRKVEIFNDSFNMDSILEKNSIDKLSKLKDIEWIFTAHYGNTDDFDYAFSGGKN